MARAAGGELPPLVLPQPPSPAQPEPEAPVESPSFLRLRKWHMGFDVRGELHSLFKIYNGGADAGGGGGIAAGVEVARYVAPDPGSSTWGGLALGFGLALHYDAWAIGGIEPGVLGARGIEPGVTTFLEVEPSIYLGGRLGIGSFANATTWRGVILGATWAPTYVYFTGTDRFDGGGAIHPGGLRFTADIGSLDAARESREAIFRLSFTCLLHVNDLPTMLTLGGGVAFY
jgi:hypothetical protein